MPFLTVGDLGILRSVKFDGEKLNIAVSPTYSACPAVTVIEKSIQAAVSDALRDNLQGADSLSAVVVERALSPAWTTEDLTAEGKDKLLANGIAPPVSSAQFIATNATGADPNSTDQALSQLNFFAEPEVVCPRCRSSNTQRISEFGSTPCKSQYRCDSCREPFDHFKCLR